MIFTDIPEKARLEFWVLNLRSAFSPVSPAFLYLIWFGKRGSEEIYKNGGLCLPCLLTCLLIYLSAGEFAANCQRTLVLKPWVFFKGVGWIGKYPSIKLLETEEGMRTQRFHLWLYKQDHGGWLAWRRRWGGLNVFLVVPLQRDGVSFSGEDFDLEASAQILRVSNMKVKIWITLLLASLVCQQSFSFNWTWAFAVQMATCSQRKTSAVPRPQTR